MPDCIKIGRTPRRCELLGVHLFHLETSYRLPIGIIAYVILECNIPENLLILCFWQSPFIGRNIISYCSPAAGAGVVESMQRKYDFHPLLRNQRRDFFICQKVVESRMMLRYYKCAAVPPAEGRWFYMNDNISAFIISVAASVVGYYICKWLDRWWTGGNSLNGLARRKEQEKPQSCNSGVFRFVLHELFQHLFG